MTCILVADDSLVDQMLIVGLLQTHPGYQIERAENGAEALHRVLHKAPDLVVTDLIMPEMDGLDLVQQLRDWCPQVPVILMTAYGNESIAVAALEAGAASYVPKAHQAERLLETVQRVLARSQAERQRTRLAGCITEFHCTYCLDNDPELIEAFVADMQTRLAGIGIGDAAERVRTAVALEEALLNALYHGNLEISERELAEIRSSPKTHALAELVNRRQKSRAYKNRRTRVDAHVSAEGARFVIRDNGRGFDVPAISSRSDSDSLATGRSRGLRLIRSLMDEAVYNDQGNEVTLVKRSKRRGVSDQYSASDPPISDDSSRFIG